MAITLNETILRGLEDAIAYFDTPTGDAVKDHYHSLARDMFSSPDSSGIQEKILAEACGSVHKGGKKLGADATLEGVEVEIKPCKQKTTTSAVNITDDQPTRLIKDLQTPSKLLVIGRCPSGNKFRWALVCRMTDFAQSRYLSMCKHWKHTPEPWPASVDDQIKAVERLAEKRTVNSYVRSSQLKFNNIQTILAGWVHPDVDTKTLTRRAEDDIIRKIARR